MSLLNVFGLVLMGVGLALWIYGYFAVGHESVIDWGANLPAWISDFLPTVESEIGILIMFVACFPAYWPKA